MTRLKKLLRSLNMTLRLYWSICLGLLLLTLLQWSAPLAGVPASNAYAYQYGLGQPWLTIYKTADMGPLHLFQALSGGYNLGSGNWLLYPAPLLVTALIVFICIGLYRWLACRNKTETLL